MTSAAIGFDIGGSTVRVGLVRVDGRKHELKRLRRRPLTDEDKPPEKLVALMADLVGEVQGEEVVDRVGVGLCAWLTDNSRTAVNSPNLGWRDVPIADLLEAALPQARVALTNDLNAIALGECRFGAARGCKHVVAMYPGTGIGGAVIVGGRVVEGAHGFAGEIGHVRVADDVRCGCGQIGCLETVGGGRYIEQRVARDRATKPLDPRFFPSDRPLRPPDVDRAFKQGDAYAQTLWTEVAHALGLAAATAVAFLDPEMVLLGGGVLEHCPALAAMLTEEIRRRSPSFARDRLRIALGTLGASAGVLGAASLALDPRPSRAA